MKKTNEEDELGVKTSKQENMVETVVNNYSRNKKIVLSQIPFKDLEKHGINADALKETGALDMLLDGKMSGLVPINILDAKNNIVDTSMAKLLLYKNASGECKVRVYPVKDKPNLDEYHGHKFTPEQKEKLLTTGNMGEAVEVKFPDGKKTTVLLSLDKETNHIFAKGQEYVKMYVDSMKTYFGGELDKETKAAMIEGKAVRIENITRKDGTLYTAVVQYNALKKGFETISSGERQAIQQVLGVKLSENQIEQLANSFDKKSNKVIDAIYLKDMIKKNGEKFTSFVFKNKDGLIKFSSVNPVENNTVKTEVKTAQKL